ncbi:MAG TPA: HpcH/HpaI aldolase family protein [Candidatus Wunengus sp. YC65]|uniref:HpcH/HpaI aldolase family protein n=1 Tax=Candidatus Wunengus sp. YC65 TaxID=3367701 RepID=UPI0040276F3B
MDSLKNKLKNGKISLGSWITVGHPAIAEIMAKSGFDWLTVDMEHSAITLYQAQQLIQIIELCGVTPLVRVGENNPNLIKRVMDAGAHGVIVPMVNTKEDAINAVNAVKYPPLGTRGVGLARAQGYGLEFERYRDWVNKESVVIVQIEHIKAVENLEDILQVEGVDAFMVGPYDLSGSIGYPGNFEHPDMCFALKRIMDVSKKLNKVAGFHVIPPDAEAMNKKIREGYRFIGFSLDTLFLGVKCREEMKKLKGES